MSYLAFARAQEQSISEGTDGGYLQVRQLIKQAIEIPTPDGIANFLNFSTAFRRLGIWNARMAYIQRPGARIIASEYEWKTVSRSVVADAVPIMILWPFSPIRYVYELEDTEPRIDREAIKDPFAAKGNFDPRALPTLMASLQKQKRFKIIIQGRRLGFSYAGSAVPQTRSVLTAILQEENKMSDQLLSPRALRRGVLAKVAEIGFEGFLVRFRTNEYQN